MPEPRAALADQLERVASTSPVAEPTRFLRAPAVAATLAGIAAAVHWTSKVLAEVRSPIAPITPRAELASMRGEERRHRAQAVRDQLADVFNPIAADLANATKARMQAAIADIPRLGGEPIVRGFDRTRMFRFLKRNSYDPQLHDLVHEQVVVKQTPHPDARIVYGGTQFRQFNRSYDEVLRTGANPLDLNVIVGNCGVPLAIAIARAGQAMRAIVIDTFLERANALTDAHAELLEQFTIHEGVVNTMLEGVQAYEASLALLTARHSTGLSPDALLVKIDEAKLVNRLSAGPLAFVGPTNTFGVVPKESVCFGDKGKLVLSPTTKALMRKVEDGMVMNYQHLRGTGQGCPLLRTRATTGELFTDSALGSVMSQLGHEFIELTRAYLREPTSAAHGEAARQIQSGR